MDSTIVASPCPKRIGTLLRPKDTVSSIVFLVPPWGNTPSL
ncbi:MAG: hypothetical protein ACOYME_10250 [Prochlorotrichaceae cyanobacterium]